MFDTEKLIVEVEQRPCIWNLSEKLYSDKFLKQKAWQEVAENCFEEWNNFANDEKQNRLDFLQKKWKSVRDYYMREKKRENERSGSAAKKKKPCPYFDLLQFLKITKQPRTSSSNVTSPESMNEDSNLNSRDEDFGEQLKPTAIQPSVSRAPTSMQTVSMPPVYQSQPSTSKQAMPSQSFVSRACKRKMTPFQECLLKKFDNNDDNPNRHFLLSFLPEMSKMTERQNFAFRMEVMKALNKVKYQIPDTAINRNCPRFSSPDSYSNEYSLSPVNRGYTTPSNECNETNEYDEINEEYEAM